MIPLARLLLVVTIGLAAATSHATFHTFRIEQLYSNADGSVQFIVLRESSGLNGQGDFAGLSLTASKGGVTKSLDFPSNLPSNTSGRRVLIATQGFVALGLVAPNYTGPDRFLPTDGGTVNFAGVSSLTYVALPIDGINALFSSGTIAPNTPTNFSGTSSSVPASPVTAVAYFNAALDHYFISSLAPDIDALDSGRIAGWTRTAGSFRVFPTQASGGAGVSGVCRIYIPPGRGDSHFFSASAQECSDTLTKFPFMLLETSTAFFVALPDTASGACPPGAVPVYRVWNNRADSNHRYMTDRTLRDAMVAAGGIAEGYGPDQVILCGAP